MHGCWGGETTREGRWVFVVRAENGGEEGIRTPATVSSRPDFESGAFSHSATSPWELKRWRGYLKRALKSTALSIT